MDIKSQIIQKLEEVVKELTKDISAKGGSASGGKIELSRPNDDKNGDYSSNVALRLSKILGKNPLEIAQKIAEDLGFKVKEVGIEKIEAVAPGFINFYLSEKSLITHAQKVLESPEKFIGILKNPKYPKAIVEYSSPNIAKPFTVGHFRSTIIGDAIANLLAVVGYDVYRDNHLGDWGTQFGKQIYAIKNIPLHEYPEGSNIEKMNEEELNRSENPIKDLVALYVKFHEEAEKKPELEEEGRKWFKKLEDGDKEARRLWQKCIDLSFKEFDRIYSELHVPSQTGKFFENAGRGYGEAFFENKMAPIIKELKEKDLLIDNEGAELIYFPKDKYPPLMIIKKDGATLYATRDLATDKFRLLHYGKNILVVNEVGSEQSLYFKQIYEIEYMLSWYKPGQRIHVSHGMFRFKEGKMSTRKGNVIWLDDVLKEAKERAAKLGSVNTTIVQAVAIGALKWNDLKRSAHLDVTFDWDEVLSMQGNSGPYVQYSYTRTHSILTKSGISTIKYPRLSDGQALSNIQLNSDELKLLRTIQKFPEIVEEAAVSYSPNVATEYLFTLAQLFNNFYQKYRILNATTDEEKQFRLALTATVGIVIKQGLGLLGIAAPEKM